MEEGSRSRWFVESATFECDHCRRLFNTRELNNRNIRTSDPCRFCTEQGDAGKLQRRPPLLVDEIGYLPVGECACEHFQFNLKKAIAEIPPGLLGKLSMQAVIDLRCDHIKAVREFSHNLYLAEQARDRMIHARGQTEANQP